eukprot:521777_1
MSSTGTATFVYVSNSWTHSFVTNQIRFEHSTFIDGGNGLIVLYVEPSTLIDIAMDDIHVSYSQYIPQYVSSTNLADQEVIHIASSNANLDLRNSVITTLIHCSVDGVITSTGRRRRLAIEENPPLLPWCNSPHPFLFNNGAANILNVLIESDFNAAEWKQYFLDNAAQYANGGVNYLPTQHHDFSLSNTAWDNEPYFAAILNEYDGVMDVINLNVVNGAHYSILFNRNGVVTMDGVYTQYQDNNASSYYDQSQLMFQTCITNNFGTLSISNGAISGADKSLINTYAGDISITNVTLSQSMLAVVTQHTASEIYLNNVEVFEVGTYYATLGAAVYHGSSPSWMSENDVFYDALNSLPPVHLSGKDVVIQNCLFYYTAPYGVVNVNQLGVFASVDRNRTRSNLIMMGNLFYVVADVLDTRWPAYKGYHYFTDFNHLSGLTNGYFGASVAIDAADTFISKMIAGGKSMKGLIFIGNQYQLSYTRNAFYLTETGVLNGNASNVYVDTDTDTNCMSGNVFYNVNLVVHSGDILSCKHLQIALNEQKCVRYLGSINNTFPSSHFISSSIVITASASTIITDDAIFEDTNTPIQIVTQSSDTNVLFVDTIFSNTEWNAHLIDDCNVICHQIIGNNESQIRQFYAQCNVLTPLITPPISLDFWTPYYLILNPDNLDHETLIYAGQSMHIHYNITDYYDNIVNKSYYPQNITILIENTDIPVVSTLDIDKDGLCPACESGIDLSSLTMYDVNKSFVLSVSILGNKLITNSIDIKISNCPSGYGISTKTLQCEECIEGRYKLSSNLEGCNVCDPNIDYIDCPGSNIVIAEFNHWIDVVVNETIMSSDCPNGFCCQRVEGCNYLLHSNELCALNRDPSTPLCGQCQDGYSELLGTPNCGECDRTRYEYFLLPLVISVLFSTYLLYFDVPPAPSTSNEPPPKPSDNVMVFKDDQRALAVIVFKVLLYFAQGLTFILLASSNVHDGLMFYLLPILQVFNLSVQFGVNSSDEEAGYCLIAGMTALTEILLNLCIPIFIAIIITFSWILAKCCGCTLQCCCFKQRAVSHISAYLRGLLIVIGSVLAVIFKLLSCRDIDSDLSVHFYYGSHECYDGLWYLSLAGLVVIFIVWCALDVELVRMKDKRQQRIENNLWTMISAYKPDHWYWETVLFTRRTFLALFTSIHENSEILNDILAALLCIYFGLHIWKQPFKYKRVNRLESICILMLLFVIIFVNNDIFKSDDGTTSIILGVFLLICVLIPLLMVMYEILRLGAHLCRRRKLSEQSMRKIELRAPTNPTHTMVPTNDSPLPDANEKEALTTTTR